MDLPSQYTPPIDKDNHHDIYCFECHHDGDVISCDSCPRVYHTQCLGLIALHERDWTCPECEVTQSSFNIINESISSQLHSINEFHIMLKQAMHRLKSQPQIKHFIKQTSEYRDNVIHPMDLETIEKHINQKKYSSTKAFIGDIKWIYTIVLFTMEASQSKLTSIARTLLKISQQEMTEIEICPECYLRAAQIGLTDWFTMPCAIPHTLCWAKMKSYQAWPAKVLRIVNNEVDVRFFGQHDRAWVSINNCFVLSKEYPGPEKKKSNINFEKSLVQLQHHIDQLKILYGHFTYAPPQTLLSKTKPFKFVSIIDDSILPSYMTAANRCTSVKHSRQQRFSTHTSSSESNIEKSVHHFNDNSYEHQRSTKRIRMSDEKDFLREDNELQPTLNVFDIFNQTFLPIREDNDLPSIRSCSPTDYKFQIQALLRRYINCQPSATNFIPSDVRSSMNALLDAIEAVKTISEVHTNVPVNNQLSKQRTSKKKPRKSNLQHRILQKNTNSNLLTCSSLDHSFSSSLPFIPLRPLSASPPSDNFESIPSVPNKQQLERRPSIEILDVKSELIDNEEHQAVQSSISTNSFLISPSLNTDVPLPTIIPNFTTIPQQISHSSLLPIDPCTQKPRNTTYRQVRSSTSSNLSLQNRSNGSTQSRLASDIVPIPNQNAIPIPQHANQISLDNHKTRNEIQMIINNFNDQFQQLLVNLTNQIESSLETTRLKYENDLEEIHRSYRLSLNDLHSIANEQVQEIHQSLELQYWTRLSEMRNRYESKLQYQ